MMQSYKITTILSALVIGVFASYIFLVSSMASVGFSIDRMEKQLADLERRESAAVTELAQSQHPGELWERSEALGLVEIRAITQYIDARAPVLGVR